SRDRCGVRPVASSASAKYHLRQNQNDVQLTNRHAERAVMEAASVQGTASVQRLGQRLVGIAESIADPTGIGMLQNTRDRIQVEYLAIGIVQEYAGRSVLTLPSLRPHRPVVYLRSRPGIAANVVMLGRLPRFHTRVVLHTEPREQRAERLLRGRDEI